MGKSVKKPWTPSEIAVLRREFPRRSAKDVALFTGHSVLSVRRKAHNLGLRGGYDNIEWEPWMVSLLKENYAVTKNRVLAGWLGVGVCSLSQKAAELGLTKKGSLYRRPRKQADGSVRAIGPDEGAYIRAHAGTDSLAAIAEAIGFAKCSVSDYCRRHGIPHEVGYSVRNDDGTVHRMGPGEDAFLRANAGTMSWSEMARRLGFHKSTVGDYCRRHGIPNVRDARP